MNKQTHNILDYIGDDGELVYPFPLDNEFNLSGDLLDYVEDSIIIYRHPAHTRLARLQRWWERMWFPLIFCIDIFFTWAICWVLYWVLGLLSY